MPEPVENVWNAYFAMETSGLRGDGCGNLLFHVEHLGGFGSRRVLAGRLFHVEHIQRARTPKASWLAQILVMHAQQDNHTDNDRAKENLYDVIVEDLLVRV